VNVIFIFFISYSLQLGKESFANTVGLLSLSTCLWKTLFWWRLPNCSFLASLVNYLQMNSVQ